jgi:hypothetical protein
MTEGDAGGTIPITKEVAPHALVSTGFTVDAHVWTERKVGVDL